jgi:beta-glucanase (GH16 family)
VFEDNFNTLDKTVWSLRGQDPWGDGQAHANSSYKPARIYNGKLNMRVLPDPQTPGDLLVPHIGTQDSFLFKYGYAEARMRFYPYHGIHASFWLQSIGPYRPGFPEIDVVEYFGAHNPERKSGINVFHNVYYRNDPSTGILNKKIVTNSNTFGANWFKEFHNFGVAVRPDGYEFFIDRMPMGTITGVQDEAERYLILSNLCRDYEWPYTQEHPLKSYRTTVDLVRVWQ